MTDYQDKHLLDVSCDYEILPPDYQAYLDDGEWWETIDADTEYQQTMQQSMEDF